MICEEFRDLLDQYIDGTLEGEALAEFERHAEDCPDCAAEKHAAEALRDAWNDIPSEIPVPLACQAKWQNAIKKEARKRKLKIITRAVSAAAAVCVVTAGVLIFQGQRAAEQKKSAYVVQADDASSLAMAASLDASEPEEYVSITVTAQDKNKARGMLDDIISEYDAVVDRESTLGDTEEVYLTLPEGSEEDFAAALEAIGEVSGEPANHVRVILK